MMSSCFTGAIELEAEPKLEPPHIENVHIAIFFDGTSNNMVQQAYFHTLKSKEYLKLENGSISQQSLNKQNKTKKEIEYKLREKDELNKQLTSLLAEQALYSNYNYNISPEHIRRCNVLYNEIKQLDEQIQQLQAEAHINVHVMASDKEQGYSNIAILHSLLQNNQFKGNDKYYNLYIEGSGATDVAFSEGETSYLDESNTNGLGFGLGKTGVSALVSKAVKYIHTYLNNIQSKEIIKLSNDTEYHFYVFGFSRGATCARLFTELATREKGSKLNREYEFGQDTSKVKDLFDKKNNRIPFMEGSFVSGIDINKEKVFVDFLGIYDTVASIGFLKQKDGWTNALSWAYRGLWWSNYRGNFHYMNVADYGLSSSKNNNVGYTCHICAADEFRENFALVNLGKELKSNESEIIIPGCHSDVGGGYVDENSMDFLLYKFVPRKFEHFLKHNKLLEILGFPYLKSKDRAKMFVEHPMETDKTEELNATTLAKLGWIGNEWRGKKMDLYEVDKKPYTLRVAEWPNEIKFKRFSLKGYSNIPLMMMKSCVEKKGIDWLFQPEIPNVYSIPKDLTNLGNEMINIIAGTDSELVVKPESIDGKRLWLCPAGGYSGENYRKLRLMYLHFTSSCELMHYRSKIKDENMRKIKEKDSEKESPILGFLPREFNLANFGNNCNYDNDARICRIMYNGDVSPNQKEWDNYQNYIHYMYELGEVQYSTKFVELKQNIDVR